jgi:hypothetical protein
MLYALQRAASAGGKRNPWAIVAEDFVVDVGAADSNLRQCVLPNGIVGYRYADTIPPSFWRRPESSGLSRAEHLIMAPSAYVTTWVPAFAGTTEWCMRVRQAFCVKKSLKFSPPA